MTESFLLNMLRVAYDLIKAERAFAVNTQLAVVGTVNITPEQIEAPYLKCVREAMHTGSAVLTDNYTITMDPAKAPVTNQSFPKLRFIVVLPVAQIGAICLDQSLRGGVTSKDKVDRLAHLIRHVLDSGQTDLDEDELLDLYHAQQP